MKKNYFLFYIEQWPLPVSTPHFWNAFPRTLFFMLMNLFHKPKMINTRYYQEQVWINRKFPWDFIQCGIWLPSVSDVPIAISEYHRWVRSLPKGACSQMYLCWSNYTSRKMLDEVTQCRHSFADLWTHNLVGAHSLACAKGHETPHYTHANDVSPTQCVCWSPRSD